MRAGISQLIAGLCLGSVVIASQPAEPEKRLKVAEGTYLYEFSAAEKQRMEEEWELYRTSNGYVVEARSRILGDEETEKLEIASWFWLSGDMVISRWMMELTSNDESATDKRIGCDLGSTELRCWDSTGEGRLTVASPYAVSTMVPSQWFFRDVALHSRLPSTGNVARVKTVFWDAADGPQDLTLREFEVVYLDQEVFRVDNKNWMARRFLMTPVLEEGEVPGEDVPRMVVTLSEQGLLLELRIETVPEPGVSISLVQYRQYAEFGPGK